MTVGATQISDDTIVVLVTILTFIVEPIAVIYLLENGESLIKSFKQGIISKKWLFRKRKYKIVNDKERNYNVYQQTIIGLWFSLDYYYCEESAKKYIYKRYTETTEKHTKNVNYITIKSENDLTKLIN